MTNMTEFYNRVYWLNKSDSLTTPLGKNNLNNMDGGIKTLDGRVVELYTETVRLDTAKANKDQLKGMVTNWQIDDRTGIVTLTKYDGTKISINTSLNQLAVNFEYNATTQQLIITQTDGSKKIVDMSALITQYEFLDTDTVSFFVDENGKVSAKVKEGSIQEKHLQPNYLADIKVEVAKAQGYANDAQDSADNAAYDAKLSQSYAVGGSGIRENEDTDNAREYAKQAKESADTAQELVGGKFIPADEKGAASGVATLDENSKVPKEQLPDLVIDGKKLINAFSTRPSTLNVDNSAEPYKNGVTYMMATLAANDSGTKPLGLDAYVFNLAWDEYKYGCQVAFSDSVPYARAFMRRSDRNGNWLNWNEMLTTTNFRPIVYQITAGNEINLASGISAVTSDYLWINYRDAGTNALVSGSKITKYILGNGNGSRASLECAGLILSTPPDNLSIASVPFVLGFVNGTTKLKIVQRNNFIQAKSLNGYYGMAVGNYEDNVWVRTTTQGIIPYQSGAVGSGHCSLGTNTWSFNIAYIDKIVTRSIGFNDTITMIQAFDDGDGAGYGCELVVTGMGNTFVGAGESARDLRTTLQNNITMGESYNKTAERLYLTSDAEIFFYSNANTVGNRIGMVFDTASFFRPIRNNVINLGRIDTRFKNFYANDVNTSNIHTDTIYAFQGSNTSGPYIKMDKSNEQIIFNNSSYGSSSVGIAYIFRTNSNYFRPTSTNDVILGGASFKWKEVYATNGTIQTSDKNEKKEISYIGQDSDYDTYMDDETLKSFICGLLPVIYKRVNGESGRPHHGLIAQDVEKLLQKLGIKDHAAFIKSPKTETIEIEEEFEETYTDETDGQVKTRTVIQKKEEQRIIPGEYVYGLRYEEFIADIVRFVQLQDEEIETLKRKTVEQEEKINKQQEELDSQRAEINDLKTRLERLEALMLY